MTHEDALGIAAFCRVERGDAFDLVPALWQDRRAPEELRRST